MYALYHWLRDQFDWKKIWRSRTTRSIGHHLAMAAICILFAAGPFFVAIVPLFPDSVKETLSTNYIVGLIVGECRTGELLVRDTLERDCRFAVGDPHLVFVAIDDQSINTSSLFSPEELSKSPPLKLMSHGWPWPRETYGLVLDRLCSAGAKIVALDILFPSEKEGDDKLKAALDRYHDQVVVGVNMVKDEDVHHKVRRTFDFPAEDIIKDTLPPDPRLALVSIPTTDDDSIFRGIIFKTYLGYDDKYTIPALSAAVVQKFGREDLIPKDFNSHILRFSKNNFDEQIIPVWQLFYPAFWEHNLKNGDFFKDKIVVVGPFGNWTNDKQNTPHGLMAGPIVHLHAISALLHREFIEDKANYVWLNLIIILIATVLPLTIEWSIHQPLPRIMAVLIVITLFISLLVYLYDGPGIFILSFAPIFIFSLGSISCMSYDFILERIERNRVRSMFERYMSKNVVGQMLDSSEDFQQALGGARKQVTILFSDIRGFTTMTEGADSHELVTQLNEYLTEMVACVFSEKGTLDKFIGDAVMGVWGNAITRTPKDDCVGAVHSALKMYAALARLNEKWESEGKKRLAIGIGINHGEAIVGNMGSPERMEFTVIGDPVNLASRLEGLTKEYHSDILIGETVAPLVKDDFILRTVALVTVKGKTKPVETFSVLGLTGDKLSPQLAELLPIYEEGILQYRSRKFAEAVGTFGHCLKIMPDDFLSADYLKESLQLLAEPPDESWTGVAVMTKK